MQGFYAVFFREVFLLFKRIGTMGYIMSSIISPFIYLFAFGFGLGKRVDVAGGYLPFLAGGIISITIMVNAFQQTSSSVSIGKFYYHIFQNLVLSPNSALQIIGGIIAGGIVRGILFGGLIFLMAGLVFNAVQFSWMIATGAVLGAFCFASLGTIVGLLVNHPDDVSFVNNFLIMPMTFFGGTFFPVDGLPPLLKGVITLFPIGALNRMCRSLVWDSTITQAALLLTGLGTIFCMISIFLFKRYSE